MFNMLLNLCESMHWRTNCWNYFDHFKAAFNQWLLSDQKGPLNFIKRHYTFKVEENQVQFLWVLWKEGKKSRKRIKAVDLLW